MAKKKTNSKRGRKSLYREEYAEQARKLCKIGAIDKDLAEFFGVSEKTINTWKIDYPEFLQSLKGGKEMADQRVERALFERAIGYEHPSEEVFQYQGSPVRVDIIKKYAPDVVACIFWLKNRRPDLWREKPIAETDNTAEVPEDYREALRVDEKAPTKPIL